MICSIICLLESQSTMCPVGCVVGEINVSSAEPRTEVATGDLRRAELWHATAALIRRRHRERTPRDSACIAVAALLLTLSIAAEIACCCAESENAEVSRLP